MDVDWDFVEIGADRICELRKLQTEYKRAIGEPLPTDVDMESLRAALDERRICFYGCCAEGRLIACCSVARTYSTFDYGTGGVFEDFYIAPEYRHRGIARRLVRFAFERSGVSSLTVGCADCDVDMYRALGFGRALGNMLAYEA